VAAKEACGKENGLAVVRRSVPNGIKMNITSFAAPAYA
jgi:hypothetical protein